MADSEKSNKSPSLAESPKAQFSELVSEALAERKLTTYPIVESYLADVLCHYMFTENLFETSDENGRRSRPTLAELLLTASNSDSRRRVELLKKLGDSSLYISGFFGESLTRKVVDIDYYVDMGCTAYESLASVSREDMFAKVYREIAHRFVDFVDVFTCISARAMPQSTPNLLDLYTRHSKVGSQLSKEKLLEMGILTPPDTAFSSRKQ